MTMSGPSHTAYIALGSNLGDRRAHLDLALAGLRHHPGIEVAGVSSYHETEPVGGPAGQQRYLNAAASLRTDLSAQALLTVLLDVDQQLGRVRQEHWGPRTIDLDLLLFDLEIVGQPGDDLVLPHPRMHQRAFVLVPLAEIAPLAVHPVLQATIQTLLERLRRPERELAGLRALVTGATSGIGLAIAGELARCGADVLVHGRRESTHQVAESLQVHGVRGEAVLADLRDAGQCAKLADQAWQTWAGLDIWINNAGADTLTGDAASWPFEKKLAELWAVDVQATIALARDVGQRMFQQGSGVIVNMGWDQAETGMEGDSGQLFGAIKGAVMAFSKSLAKSLAPKVRVNCLAPGWIRTAWGDQASTPWQERVRRETPLQRWGTPEDVAHTARWLVSPAATFTTGQILRINGGAIC